MALIGMNFQVKTQRWLGVMSYTSEHIHREKLDMHAAQFFLGMKFTQNCLHKIDENERPGLTGWNIDPICGVGTK